MGRKSKVSADIKIKAVEAYLRGEKSSIQIADQLFVSYQVVFEWIKIYNTSGVSGLISSNRNQSYPPELKLAAVQDYLSGRGSQWSVSLKYGLRSRTQLRSWISKYNSHEKIKSSGGNPSMTKGRKTTLTERVQIVIHCIANDNNYKETSEKFEVSYQQVRSWVLKYEEKGLEGLEDRRGKRKPENELTEAERMKAEIELLKAKNKRLEIENELLKKLEEIERR